MAPVSVNVNSFGLWQMYLGAERRLVKVNGSTVRDLLGTLNDLSDGRLANEALVVGGRLDPKFKIFVNGSLSDSLAANLNDGDEVLLFSVIDGG